MRRNRSRGRTAVVGAAVAALVAAGCGAGENDDAGGPGEPFAPPAADIAPGVTDTTIKVGITYPDLSAIRQLVNIDHGDYEAVYTALITKLNADGGINGRVIQPVFGKVNPLAPTSAQEACRKLTQDEKVFVALGSFNADEPLCYVGTNQTAVIGGPLTAKNYAQAQAPWFSYARGGDEVADGLELFARQNALAGKKVAVVGVVNEQALVREIAVPALQRNGVNPVETAILDTNFRDAAAVAQQTAAIVQKVQAAGADTVVVVGGMGQQFPMQLEKTNYRPQLLFTDVSSAEVYTRDTAKHDYGTLVGAAALGPVVRWEESAIRECIADVETAIPALDGKVSLDPRTVPIGSPTPQVAVETACRNLDLFTAIATKAGDDLTYASFQEAGFTLGPLRVANYVDQANYTRATPHGAIPVRIYSYDPERNAYRPGS
ncbi:hypothetical protein [Yinghuangia sp. YIM S10712]|uniref:hypothetical protein n=1 Tax=Yinghuangia sp. YIM S10712 TaxID=3436930 RepID=UPI003F53BC1E